MRTYHLYDLSTGLFDGRRFSTSDAAAVAANSHGMGTIEGVTDPESQRVDIETGALVDYQPPRPDEHHEWIERNEHGQRIRRWVLKSAIAERRNRVAAIHAQLAALDARLVRALGELADEAYLEPKNIAFSKVADINKQKGTLRAELRALESTA